MAARSFVRHVSFELVRKIPTAPNSRYPTAPLFRCFKCLAPNDDVSAMRISLHSETGNVILWATCRTSANCYRSLLLLDETDNLGSCGRSHLNCSRRQVICGKPIG